MIPTYVQGETLAPIDIMKGQIESAPVNQLTEVTRTLPTIGGQAYTHGLLDFGKDQAWVAECEIPAGSPYWGVQLMDYAYNTLDVMYTQASLNGHSARVDSDGKVRIVVCEGDPGAANWLDLGGHERVQIRFRWFGSEQPRIVTRLVPLAELHESLPSDTSTVSPGERQAALRERARGMQLRRRW
jgi:hypothetical protein